MRGLLREIGSRAAMLVFGGYRSPVRAVSGPDRGRSGAVERAYSSGGALGLKPVGGLALWVPTIRSWALTRGFALHPGTRNRYKIRYTTNQHRPPSRQVNDHGRVSGTHRAAVVPAQNLWIADRRA